MVASCCFCLPPLLLLLLLPSPLGGRRKKLRGLNPATGVLRVQPSSCALERSSSSFSMR
ncbi:Uncharacterised protein [Mycobacterium tuberculosis]|nr:Uncharacterised protein [Mycobacterium tuberculosis]